MKLYTVTSVVKEWHGCKDVSFHWFKSEPEPGVRPYAQLIADYVVGDDTEGFVDELFTEVEAKQLASYLDQNDKDDSSTVIEEVSLPLDKNIMPFGAIPVGGTDDFYMLCKVPGYCLSFDVWGYFDLHGCQLIAEPGILQDRLLQLGTDGELRSVNVTGPIV